MQRNKIGFLYFQELNQTGGLNPENIVDYPPVSKAVKMTTWIHRCVSLQCCCVQPSWQPVKAPMPPFLSAHPPSFPQIFWMTRPRDRWIRPGAFVPSPESGQPAKSTAKLP